MLQSPDIMRRFSAIAEAIGQASQACSADRDVPNELRVCIQKLDKQSDLARPALQSHDDVRVRKLVAELEQLGDRAKLVCSSGANVTPHMRVAVMRVHDELSALRHQLE